jgi:hypothetical protein
MGTEWLIHWFAGKAFKLSLLLILAVLTADKNEAVKNKILNK